ncbi:MAG: hypothetical protein ISS66_12985 [Desulfobacteraceae bacterium]|nr:hypothetical protein [Desulfobacteraceae bacterium]
MKNDKTDSDKKSLSDSKELLDSIFRKETVVHSPGTTWRSLNNRRIIVQLLNHLISNRIEIKILFTGKKAAFTSRFIKLKQEDPSSEIGKRLVLIIEKLSPPKGNTHIQSYSEVDVKFFISQKPCRCTLEYIGINNTPPHFGFILSFPESVKIGEKRREERISYESSEFITAEFRLGKKKKKDILYELNVLNHSRHGLGIIITQKDFDLLKILHKGDKLADISFFTSWSIIKVDGIVRHITKIEEGEYKGCYLLGIGSGDIIESGKPA